jgi:hypothetical protein
MSRLLQIGSLVLLAAGASFGRKQTTPKPSPQQQNAVKAAAKEKSAQPNKGGIPKQPIPKGGARMVNPESPAARLYRMTPEERDRVIEKLPNPRQRERVRNELALFDALPKDAQELQLRRLDRFARLSPEKKAEVGALLNEFRELPPPRRVVVQRALYELQQMNDQQRENTLHRPRFQARFSADELRIVNGLADAWMGPIEAPPPR